MKAQKIITIITIILLVTIITLASFFGIYKKQEYRISNIVPEYILGMEFTDSRMAVFEVDDSLESTIIYDQDGNEVTEQEEGVEYTEENGYTIVENKVNDDETLTQENYELSKKILKNRLDDLEADEYYIKQNEDGSIQIEMTDDDNTDDIISALSGQGIFQLTDSDTSEVLLDNSYIKNTKVVYGQTDDSEYTVYLQIIFNKEGTQKLEEISQTYISTTVETTDEDGETEETTETKNVEVIFDGETYMTTYFGETISDGTLNISVGSASDSDSLQGYVQSGNQMKAVLDSGILPITYDVSTYTVSSAIDASQINILIYISIAIILLISIYIVIKLKMKGVLAVILQIGYVALLLLALRYTNIKITMEGLIGIVISIIVNYMYIYFAFKDIDKNFLKDVSAKFALKLIPIYIIAVVFTFNKIANISSLGMTLVWGIITMYLYNLILTQITIKTIKK